METTVDFDLSWFQRKSISIVDSQRDYTEKPCLKNKTYKQTNKILMLQGQEDLETREPG